MSARVDPALEKDVPIDREAIAACLLANEREDLLRTAAALCEGLTVVPLLPAEAGLALLKWRDAVMHHPFFLGEVPMSRAAVALIDAHGERAEGGAVIMADDTELAYALAVLDAVSAHDWPGAARVRALARHGAQVRAAQQAERHAGLLRTRVEFSVMTGGMPTDEPGRNGNA